MAILENQADLREDVRSLVNESTEAFWENDEIDRWLNEGQEDFSARVRALASHYTRTVEAGDIFHDRELRLNLDYIVMAEGGVVCNGTPLKWISISTLDEWGGDWRDEENEPERYYLRSDAIGFYPPPRVGDVIEYYGIERATVLGDDQAPFNGDYRLVSFRRAIRDYALSRCWEKKGELEKASRKMFEYMEVVHAATSIIHSHQASGARLVPEYRRRGRSVI